MGESIPRWERELWSYVGNGNGPSCPIYDCCHIRHAGGLCAEDSLERIKYLLEDGRFKPSDYDLIKPGRVGRVFQLVENLSQWWLKKGRISCPPVPTNLISLADENHPIAIHLLPLKANHGATWCFGNWWVIQLKRDDTIARKRFTLFHEAFHILAHCKTTPTFRKRETTEGSFNEMLAEYFATCILMPEEWVREKWMEVYDLDKVVKSFNVPKQVMYFRLRCLGLV